MPSAVAATVTFLKAVGVAVAGVGVYSSTAALVIGTATVVAGAIAAQKLISSLYSVPNLDSDSSRQATVRGTVEPQKLIYGEALVSGPISFVGVSGTDNRDLYHSIVLAGHPSDSISDIYFDDERIQSAHINGSGNVTTGVFGPKDGTTICVIRKLTGGQTVADSLLDGAFSTINASEHIGTNLTYIVTKFTLTEDSQETWDKFLPNDIKALVKGKKVYDPRQDSTSTYYDASVGVSTQRSANSATWAWSDNPVWCLVDYLTDDRFGMDIDLDRIDLSKAVDAADICDVAVSVPGGGESRYTCNGVVFGTATHKANINKILSSMNGMLTYTNGKYVIRAGAFEAVGTGMTLTEDHMTGPVRLKTSFERNERFNTITGTFVDPEKNFKEIEFPKVQITSALTRDNSEELTRELKLSMTNSRYMAQRIAHKLIQLSDLQKVLTFPTNLAGVNISVGDRVNVTLSEFGYTNKTFVCLGWTLSESGSGGVNLTLREDDSSSYSDLAVSGYSTVTPAGGIQQGFFGVPDPSGLSATAHVESIELDWTNPANMTGIISIEVFASPNSSWSSAVKIGETIGTQFIHDESNGVDAIVENDQRYYWVRARRFPAGEGSDAVSDRNPDSDTSTVQATKGALGALADQDTVGDGQIDDNAVGNDQIADNAVDTDQINDGAVDTDQIADDAVDITKIANTLQSTNYAQGSAGWKLTTDGTFEAGDGDFRGTIKATVLDVEDANVHGTLTATNISAGIVTAESLAADVFAEFDDRYGGSGGFYRADNDEFFDGSATKYVTLTTVTHDSAKSIRFQCNLVHSWGTTSGYGGTNGLKLRVTFEYSTNNTTWAKVPGSGENSNDYYERSATATIYSVTSAFDLAADIRYEMTGSSLSDNTAYYFRVKIEYVSATNAFTSAAAGSANGVPIKFNAQQTAGLTAAAGDADTVDGLQASQFLRSDTSDTFSGNLTVTGSLTVQGSQTQLDTQTLTVEDNNIVLNHSTGDSSGSADDSGITIQDAVNSSTDASILWKATGDYFQFSHPINAISSASNAYAAEFRGAPQPFGSSGVVSNGVKITAGSSSNDTVLLIQELDNTAILTINGFGLTTFANSVTIDGESVTGTKIGQWNTAYTYSQVGHLPLTGGTLTGNLDIGDGTSRKELKIKSNSYSEIHYFIKHANNSNVLTEYIRAGVSIGASTHGQVIGDYFIYTPQSQKMLLTVPQNGDPLERNNGAITIIDSSNYDDYALPLTGGTVTGAVTISGNSTFGGRIEATNGTSIKAAYAFSSNAGTGISYTSTNNRLNFMSGGAVVAYVQTGNSNPLVETMDVDGFITWDGGSSTNANTAYGWGNHATQGYLTSIPTPLSGDWWNGGFAKVLTDGVMEVGKYIDFHTTDTGTSDFDVRITASSGSIAVGGTVTTADGSNTAPAYTFTADTDTGLYKEDYTSTQRQVSISTDGVRRFYVNAAGIFTSNNFYLSASGSLRAFGSFTNITNGTAGGGFKFRNTQDAVDSLSITSGGDGTFAGVVRGSAFSTDGSAKSYTWKAIDNTSTNSGYVWIARVTATQSSRFIIELAGRSSGYGDGVVSTMGHITGQLNNDNNYDLAFYNAKIGTAEVVSEVGQVDVDSVSTDIYVQVGQFAELTATAHISDGSIATKSTLYTSQPSGYVAATEVTVWNSSNDSTLTLDYVTDNGATTTNDISVGNIVSSANVQASSSAGGGFSVGTDSIIGSNKRLTAADGTTSKAAYGFLSSSNTGLSYTSGNRLNFLANGVVKAYIQPGSSNPITPVLYVDGRAEVNGAVIWSGGTSANANTAYGWGNHASAGYRLASESLYYKPTREASGSFLNLNTATTPGIYRLHGTANHTGHPAGSGYGFAIVLDNSDVHGHLLLDRADDGRLWIRAKTTTSFATSDWNQVWSSADFSDNSTNWNTAYGWGDHSTQGYLTSIPTPLSGDWWNGGFAKVGTNGVMEVGKYIDFHATDAGTSDYDLRITASSGALDIDGDLTVDDISSGSIASNSFIQGNSFKVNSTEVVNSNRVLKNITRAEFSNFAVTGTSAIDNSIIKSVNLGHLPEDGHASHPYLFNDLANFEARGGVVSIGGLTFTPDMSYAFKASARNAGWSASNYTGSTMTITLTNLPQGLSYTGYIGISFGNPSWSPASCTIEVSTNGGSTWTTRLTNGSKQSMYFTSTGAGGTAVNAIRFTLGQPTSSMRITNIWAYNYNSNGMEDYFLSKSGGTVYGAINSGALTATAATATFGDSGTNGVINVRASSNVFLQQSGVNRATLNSAGITSSSNLYTSTTGEFRNYGGVWSATTGLTGNGFEFVNSVDGTALTLSSTGNAVFSGTISSGNITSSGAIVAGTTLQAVGNLFATNGLHTLNSAGNAWDHTINRNSGSPTANLPGGITSGAITSSGQLSLSGNNLAVFGPNTTWSRSLAIGGDANNSTATRASIGVTNGNLHIDAAGGSFGTYLNFYDGTAGVYIGNGASGIRAHFDTSGHLNLAGTGVSQTGYALSVGSTGVLSTGRNLVNIGTISSGAISSGAITASESLIASTPLTLGSSSQTSFTKADWITSEHGSSVAYILAYGAGHGSQAGNFAIKNLAAGKDIYFELASGVEPLRLTGTGATFAGAITSSGNLLLDTDNAEINIKSGVGTTSGAVNWTFNTTGTDFASIKLPYATRATTGLHIDSGYPITIDCSTRINFAVSGATRFRITNTAFEVGTVPIIDLNRNLLDINVINSGIITSVGRQFQAYEKRIHVTGALDGPSNTTTRNRHTFLQVSYNTHHWMNSGVFRIKVESKYPAASEVAEYVLQVGYVDVSASGSQNNSGGGVNDFVLRRVYSSKARSDYSHEVIVGTPTDTGIDSSGYDVFSVPILLESAFYTDYVVTVEAPYNTFISVSSFSGQNQYIFTQNPSSTNLSGTTTNQLPMGQSHYGVLRGNTEYAQSTTLTNGSQYLVDPSNTGTSLNIAGSASIDGSIDCGGNVVSIGTHNGSQFRASLGTQSAPAYTFKNDDDSGFYGGGNTVYGVTGGQKRLTLNANGVSAHNDLTVLTGKLKFGTLDVIDSSRNLTNINTISSGAITSGGLIKGTRSITSADVDYLRLQMSSWSQHAGYLKSLVWHDGANNIAGIGAEYDQSKTNIHFHSQYNAGYKGTSVRTFSVFGNGNVAVTGTLTSGAITSTGTSTFGGVQIGGTTVISSSRNLTNIQSFNTVLVPRTFSIPNTGSATSQWVYIGRAVSMPQAGNSVTIKLRLTNGYNASGAQNAEGHIRFKTANASSNDGGFYGDAQLYRFGQNTAALQQLKIVQSGTSEYRFYILTNSFTGTSDYTVEQSSGSWVNVGTFSGTAPTGTLITVNPRRIFTSGFAQNEPLDLGTAGLTAGAVSVVNGNITQQSPTYGGVLPPAIYIGQLNNAYQAGIQSGTHLTFKTTNSGGNWYWYRAANIAMSLVGDDLNMQSGGYKVGGVTVIDAARNVSAASVTSSGNVTAFSDARLKSDIKTLDGSKVLKMRGVSFIKDGEHGSGVIAQELEKVAPELVRTADDDAGTKSVAYGNVVGYLIEAVKNQQEEINLLRQLIEEMKNGNN
jgi:hypothetical protein